MDFYLVNTSDLGGEAPPEEGGGGGGGQICPHHLEFQHVDFLWLFLIFSMEEVKQIFLKKNHLFPRISKKLV